LLESEFEAVVMVADEVSLLESVKRMNPSLVVADLRLAQGEGFAWLRRLRQRCPGSRVIVLSVHDELCVMEAAFEAGAAGFVLKRNAASELTAAVDAVVAGRSYPADCIGGHVPHREGSVSTPEESIKNTGHSK
jgi:DNA-binding NarL/FixJ family response regulator